MVKRNISSYERKKEIITKHGFCTKGKVHINFPVEVNLGIIEFW